MRRPHRANHQRVAYLAAVTKDRATQVALEELRRRGVHLPAGYTIQITDDYIAQEMAPTIPTYTVTFFAGRENLGRSIKRLAMYAVAVSRSSGEFLFFSDLLKLRPSEEYAAPTPNQTMQRTPTRRSPQISHD